MDDFIIDEQEIIEQIFKEIKRDLVKLFRQAIQSEVYDKYHPKEYKRTYQLRNKVAISLDKNTIYVYCDVASMNYTSAINFMRDVSYAVPWFIQEGHNRNIPKPKPMYDIYPARHFLEKARELIQNEYPFLKVEIKNDAPPYV